MSSDTANRIGIRVAVCLAAWGFGALAFGGTHPAGTPQGQADHRLPITSRVGGAVGVRSTSIVGVAWNADNTPVPAARVRLRDVVTGKISSVAVSDEAGRFTFVDVEPGSYLIELVADGAKIVALGHTFTVARGETVATFVRIGTRVPWYTGFFGNAASAIASTAASAGVTAIAPEAKPCSSPSPGCM
jgi:carboxypeptidase family protein